MNRSLDAIILRYIGYALLFLLAAYLIYLVRGTLPIFFVAGLFAYAMEPVLRWLEGRGYSRRGAVGYVYLIFLLLFALTIALLASAWQQAQSLIIKIPVYQESFTEIVQRGQHRLDDLRLPQDVKKSINEAAMELQGRVPRFVQGIATWLLATVPSMGIFLIVMPIITFWFMMERNAMRARVLMLVPPPYRRDVTDISTRINEMLGRYVRGQMIVCGLFGFLCTTAFYILHFTYGMDYPLVLGVLAAVIYIVPYLGMATIAAAAGFTAYVTSTSGHLPCAAIAVGCCVVFNLMLDYGVSPRVLGQGVGLHPLMIIFALLSGAQIGGVMGMILAVPVFAALRVIAIYLFPQLAAPIPDTPPESNAATQTEATDQVMEQVRDAERSASSAKSATVVAPDTGAS